MPSPVIGPVNAPAVVVKVAPPTAVKLTVSTNAVERMGPPGPRGERGLQGLPGAGGGGSSSALTRLSRGPLSSGRVVRLDAGGYCAPVSALVAADALQPIGVTTSAVSAAEAQVGVVTQGECVDDTWSFTPGGAVFLGATGFLTQQRDPSWAYLRVVGFAITAQSVFVNPQLPVFLSVGG